MITNYLFYLFSLTTYQKFEVISLTIIIFLISLYISIFIDFVNKK